MCVVSVFCCDEFGSGGGYLWLGVGQVLLFDFWEVSRMSMVVWDSTGSICKVNGYLSRTGFSLLGRLWAIFCCSLAQELPRPCKFILVKGFIGASGCVKFGLVGRCLPPVGAI